MRISKKAEYALRALVALARKPAGSTSLIEEISESERIPVKFLEQILLELRRAELLRSRRGVGGGYQLNRPAVDISLGEILRIIDGTFEPISCTPADPERFGRQPCECGREGGCGLGKVFCELQRQVQSYLNTTSVADVVAKEARPSEISFDI
jgi:Rrf2 family transcriptional regulator, iron-sulfur cluster assembly transcription factor